MATTNSNFPINLGEANNKETILWEIKADLVIAQANVDSLERIVKSNSETAKQGLKGLDKEIYNLLLDERKEEIVKSKIKDRQDLVLNVFNIKKEAEKDEYARYKYFTILKLLVSSDEDNFEQSPNQIEFKRELRKKLWETLRGDNVLKCTKNNEALTKEVISLVLDFIITFTAYKENAFVEWTDESSERCFKKAFKTLLTKIESAFNAVGDTVINFDRKNLESEFAVYISNTPYVWKEDISSRGLQSLGYSNLDEDPEYKKAEEALADLERKEKERTASDEPQKEEIHYLYYQKQIEAAKAEVNGAKKDFYDKNQYTEKRDKVVKAFQEFDKADGFKRMYMIEGMTKSTQKYIAKTLVKSILKGENQFELKDVLLQVSSLLGPLAATVPFGTFFLEIANSFITESGAKKEPSLIAQIRGEFDKLTNRMEALFEEQFNKFKNELKLKNILETESEIKIELKDTHEKTLKNIDNYSTLDYDKDIAPSMIYFDNQFNEKINKLFDLVYGFTLDFDKADLELEKGIADSLASELSILQTLKGRLMSEQDSFTLYEFYERVTFLNTLMKNTVELMFLKRGEFLEFLAVAYGAEPKTAKSQKYYNTLLGMLKHQKFDDLKNTTLERINEFINERVLKMLLGDINASIVESIYGSGQPFLIKPAFNPCVKKGRSNNIYSRGNGKLSQNIDQHLALWKHSTFKINLNNPYQISGSLGTKSLSVASEDKQSDILFSSDKNRNFTLIPTKKGGEFIIKLMGNNGEIKNKCLDVFDFNKEQDAQILLWDANGKANQTFNIEPINPQFQHFSEEQLKEYYSIGDSKGDLLAFFTPGSEIVPNVKYYSETKLEYIVLNARERKLQFFQKEKGTDYEIKKDNLIGKICDQILFKEDGNLVANELVKNAQGASEFKEVWASNTAGAKHSYLAINSSKEFIIEDYQGRVLWNPAAKGKIEENQYYYISKELIVPEGRIKDKMKIVAKKKHYLDVDVGNTQKQLKGDKPIYFHRFLHKSDNQKFKFVKVENKDNNPIYKIVCAYENEKYVVQYGASNDKTPFSLKEDEKGNKQQHFLVVTEGLYYVYIIPVNELSEKNTLEYHLMVYSERTESNIWPITLYYAIDAEIRMTSSSDYDSGNSKNNNSEKENFSFSKNLTWLNLEKAD